MAGLAGGAWFGGRIEPAVLARLLRPVAPPAGGVLQQWFPEGEGASLASVAPALSDDRPYAEYILLRRTFGLGL